MPEGVDDMKIKFKKNKPVVRNTKVKDYICLNGKTLSEQTINDYAQFIPAWDEREELGDDCYLVSCVHPHNHTHNDDPSQGGTPSLMISVGNNKKVIVHCRQAACPDSAILQYFLSRLTGEVKTGTAPVSVDQVPKSKTLTKDDFVGNEHLPMGMSQERQWQLHLEIKARDEEYKRQAKEYNKKWGRKARQASLYSARGKDE